MSYRTSLTGATLLDPTTVAYIPPDAFGARDTYRSSAPPSLPALTLDAAVLGRSVIILNGGEWRSTTLTQDASNLFWQETRSVIRNGHTVTELVTSGTVPLTARALALSSLTGYSAPPSTAVVSAEENTLTGMTPDDHMFMSNPRIGVFYAFGPTTVSAATAGSQYLVEDGDPATATVSAVTKTGTGSGHMTVSGSARGNHTFVVRVDTPDGEYPGAFFSVSVDGGSFTSLGYITPFDLGHGLTATLTNGIPDSFVTGDTHSFTTTVTPASGTKWRLVTL